MKLNANILNVVYIAAAIVGCGQNTPELTPTTISSTFVPQLQPPTSTKEASTPRPNTVELPLLAQGRIKLNDNGWVITSPNGQYLASRIYEDNRAGVNGTLSIYRTDSLEEIWSVPVDGNGDISFSPDSTRLVSFHHSNISTEAGHGKAIVWDVLTGSQLFELTNLWRGTFSWSPTYPSLLALSNQLQLYLWDLSTGKVWYVLEGPPHTGTEPLYYGGKFVGDITWSPDGLLVAASYYDRFETVWASDYRVRIWSVNDGKTVTTLRAPPDSDGWGEFEWELAWSPDGTTLAAWGFGSCFDPNSQCTWKDRPVAWTIADSSTPRVDLLPDTIIRGEMSSVSWSPDGTLIATALHSKTVVISSTSAVVEIETLSTAPENDRHYVRPYALWSPLGTNLAYLADQKTLYRDEPAGLDKLTIWDEANGQFICTNIADIEPETLRWSPDGRLLAFSIEITGLGFVCDAATGNIVYEFSNGAALVEWLADGSELLSVGWNGTASRWQLPSP